MNKKTSGWDMEGVRAYFDAVELPQEVALDECTHIFDIRKFIRNHYFICVRNNGKPSFRPYYERLKKLKQVIDAKTLMSLAFIVGVFI